MRGYKLPKLGRGAKVSVKAADAEGLRMKNATKSFAKKVSKHL